MLRMLQSKKGFTLVELMVVLILLGLGAFALINLFRVAYRSFDKTEERYIKQEAVKTVAEYFQQNAAVSAANNVELYKVSNHDDLENYLAAAGNNFNFIFVDPDDGLLYVKPAGETEYTKITNTKLYVRFDEIPNTKVGGDPYAVSRGITCFIAAVEDEFEYVDDEGNNVELSKNSDDVYYSLDVSYHFANMVEDGQTYVNRVLEQGTYKRAQVNSTYVSSDTNACVVKFMSDVTLEKGSLMNETNINMYCFIATASYGTNNGDGTVGMLCDFRDTCLLTNPLGTAFVKAYYKLSPPIADVIAQHEPLRATVRVLLKPLVVFATYALNPELIYEIAPVMIITFAAGLALSVTLVRMNKKRKKKE